MPLTHRRIFQVDAFGRGPFTGNPAAIIPLDDWLPDHLLQAIAGENNLSETAFYVPRQQGFDLRWFTPTREVDLCGHATLATAWVIFELFDFKGREIVFHTRSGQLEVRREDTTRLSMLFPARRPQEIELTPDIERMVDQPVTLALRSRDLMLVLDSEEAVRHARPNLDMMARDTSLGVIITAAGEHCDFVSRFFAPNAGIDEDPVTGSAHCTLTPFWAERLGKVELRAQQLSRRGGWLECHALGDHVRMVGEAHLYLDGRIHVPFET
ncbi:MAG: PhzF family phenazine biosynthesis protein [Gammaproteobacteria bacterium]|nr:MAG: PhzF family phenazine biosynthesis protein [Gammaproteobacteria bacterium]